jgi:hypothetical protein
MSITYTYDQGTDSWFEVRTGKITASMFGVVRAKVGMLNEQQSCYVNAILDGSSEKAAREIAGYKNAPTSETIKRALAGEKIGEFSDAAKDYAFRVAVERISGESLDKNFETFAMRRGRELEPNARFAHEMAAAVTVKRAGFVATDDEVFGCSADGLMGDEGGAEYKCLIDPARMRQVLFDGDVSEFMDQVMGCLWITGRKYWHFALYCPQLASIGKELWWREFKRDDDYIERMERDLIEFKALVDENERRLREDVRIAA